MISSPRNRRSAILAAIFAAATSMIPASGAFAQSDYPNKPIRLVVPFPPGGGVDILARLISPRLQEQLGQAIVVENRPGANGNLATEAVAKTGTPDGYTLLIGGNGLATNPALYPAAGYDFMRDLTPVAFYGSAPLIMVVPSASPARGVRDIISQAKASPGSVSYASAGNGSAAHLSSELLKQTAGVDILHVPYKGGPPALTDLIGNRVSLMLLDPGQAMPHIKSGRLRGIAVSSAKRSPVLPDAPAIAEALPGYEATVWWGIVAPAKTPPAIVARLNTEINKALADPAVQARLAEIGVVTEATTPAEFGTFLGKEIDKWTRLVKSGGIKGD
ncbi:tripartite tricarboxylate transporter substrate binding protein [Variovorax sp. VNK109]|uniref:tripartite tricarboxylate transporter substrate binding protein n=1 Tax=Variovorax sp. VNK109 TaxID=3400919 RepID=UPI003C085341